MGSLLYELKLNPLTRTQSKVLRTAALNGGLVQAESRCALRLTLPLQVNRKFNRNSNVLQLAPASARGAGL